MPIDVKQSRRRFVALAGLVAATESLAGCTKSAADWAWKPLTAKRLRVSGRGPGVTGLVAIEEDGADGIHSWTGSRHWAKKPPMRVRVSRAAPDGVGGQHFMLVPYQYGMAVEYNGVLECWTEQFSIHNNTQGAKAGKRRGAILWVGNQEDSGGLKVTAHRSADGAWAELSSELFSGESGGDLRFRVGSPSDAFDFRSSPGGRENTFLRISADGDLLARYRRAEAVHVGA